MASKYEILSTIYARSRSEDDPNYLNEIITCLSNWGIRLRADDGQLKEINLSKPSADSITIGLRYLKKDGSDTEDHFEIQKGNPNYTGKYYKGSYENRRPAYVGTHKHQSTTVKSYTSVNTCSLLFDNDDS